MLNNRKIWTIFLFSLLIIVIVPFTFAESVDNETIILDNHDENILGNNNDYYFDASALDDDGDGSLQHPYKYLTQERVKENSTIHLAEGEYALYNGNSINKVNIIGSNPEKTSLNNHGRYLRVDDYVTLTNITLKNTTILNYGSISAENTVFCDGDGIGFSDGSSYGGAICSLTADDNSKITLIDCRFENNFATRGGAIYITCGYLEIIRSTFAGNYAYSYGGAIACEYATLTVSRSEFRDNHANGFGGAISCDFCGDVIISESNFTRNYCIDDAGGSIYIKSSDSLTARNLNISHSSATFGGSITSLATDVSLDNVNICNSTARYAGGAIYHMYNDLKLSNSNLINNTARNGGAVYIDNSTFTLRDNDFTNNTALIHAGAIYSIFNCDNDFTQNTFKNNHANSFDDVYQTNLINLTIGNGNHMLFKLTEEEINYLPSNYSLVDYDYLTPIKDQADGGSCWSFTAMAVLESCIKKITGRDYDFSEENMKNMMAVFSDYGKPDTYVNEGGSNSMAWAYLTSWLGPVYDEVDVYNDHSALSPVFDSVLHVQNILFLKRDNFTDNDEIKYAIMRYGAVGTGMHYHDEYYYNGTYYYDGDLAADHAVTIVGWDDNYSKDNFINTPHENGAWIVRNSWGPDWDDDGYFYVSYYDTQLALNVGDDYSYTFVLNDTLKFNRNYQYEIGAMAWNFYLDNSRIFYKNVFTATDSEVLGGVSTYFKELTNWTVSVYVNDVLKTVKNGISPAGYWTILLDDAIHLECGDVFDVVFNCSCDVEKIYLPTVNEGNVNHMNLVENVSFFSGDGRVWNDLYNYSSIACIKAFTITDDINTTLYLDVYSDGFNPVNITATVMDRNGKLVSGSIRFLLNDRELILNLTNGRVSFLYNFDKGTNAISCSFQKDGYVTSSNQTSVEIRRKSTELSLNISRTVNNLSINVTSKDNINDTVVIFVNDKNYTVNLVNGSIIYNLTGLVNGDYDVEVMLVSHVWEAENVTGNAKIYIKSTQIIAYDLTTDDESSASFDIILVDDDDNPLSGKQIIFELGSNFTKTTEGNGAASLPINLERGNHLLTIYFMGDNDYWAFNTTRSISVKTNVEAYISTETSLYDAIVNITFSKPISESARVMIDDIADEYNVVNGSILIPLSGLSNGVHNISAELLNDEYNFTKLTTNFTIDVVKTQIVASDFTTTELSGEIFNVTLSDENGYPLSSKQVRFVLDGQTYYENTDANGVAGISVNLNSGSYPIEISYGNVSDKYDGSAITKTINVKTIVSGEISYVRSMNNVILDITFNKSINDSANVSVNNELKPVTVKNGKATLSLNDLANNDYIVKIILDRSKYQYDEISTGFTVNVRNTQIIANPAAIYYPGGEAFNVKLVDENGLPLKNKTLVISLNNRNSTSKTNDDGIISIDTNGLGIANYDVAISFLGDNDYFASQKTSQITILSGISLPQSQYTLNSPYVVTFYAEGGLLINGEVRIVIDGAVHNLKTDTNGQARINIALVMGSHSVRVENLKTGEVKTQNIVVVGRLTGNANVVMYYGAGKTYNVRAFGDNGQIVGAGEIVTFSIGGKNYNVKTDSSGYATFKITQNAGTYTISATYKGFKVSNKVTIKKTLITANKSVKKGKKITYQAKLLNTNGKALKGKKITFKIKGKTYKAKTNKKGIAKITIKKSLKVGKYKITVKYGKLTSTSKITVKK